MRNELLDVQPFSDDAKKRIKTIDEQEVTSLDDLIRIQEATDRSHKLHAVLTSWSNQQTEERKLRKLYALCFVAILAIQIILMNVIFVLDCCGVLDLSETQFNIFYISMFGEIVALALIVTKYLFHKESETKLIETIKEL